MSVMAQNQGFSKLIWGQIFLKCQAQTPEAYLPLLLLLLLLFIFLLSSRAPLSSDLTYTPLELNLTAAHY